MRQADDDRRMQRAVRHALHNVLRDKLGVRDARVAKNVLGSPPDDVLRALLGRQRRLLRVPAHLGPSVPPLQGTKKKRDRHERPRTAVRHYAGRLGLVPQWRRHAVHRAAAPQHPPLLIYGATNQRRTREQQLKPGHRPSAKRSRTTGATSLRALLIFSARSTARVAAARSPSASSAPAALTYSCSAPS
jgi:hypothetical protein